MQSISKTLFDGLMPTMNAWGRNEANWWFCGFLILLFGLSILLAAVCRRSVAKRRQTAAAINGRLHSQGRSLGYHLREISACMGFSAVVVPLLLSFVLNAYAKPCATRRLPTPNGDLLMEFSLVPAGATGNLWVSEIVSERQYDHFAGNAFSPNSSKRKPAFGKKIYQLKENANFINEQVLGLPPAYDNDGMLKEPNNARLPSSHEFGSMISVIAPIDYGTYGKFRVQPVGPVDLGEHCGFPCRWTGTHDILLLIVGENQTGENREYRIMGYESGSDPSEDHVMIGKIEAHRSTDQYVAHRYVVDEAKLLPDALHELLFQAIKNRLP